MNTIIAFIELTAFRFISAFNYVVLTATEGADPGFNPLKKIVIALIIGVIVGLIYAMALKSQLTSVYKKDSAADYKKDKSFKLERERDMFLYTKTEKRETPQQNQAAK